MLQRIRLSLWVAGVATVAGGCGGAEAPFPPAAGGIRPSESKALATDATHWAQGDSALAMRMRHSAVLLESGEVLVTGGEGHEGLLWNTERYTP
jgi:hypothetical protein